MLEEQCNTWGGITSVAVYLPLVYFQSSNDDKLREAISHVENFHEQIDRTHGGCWCCCNYLVLAVLHAACQRRRDSGALLVLRPADGR